MSKKNIFICNYNGRDDNLGDVVIFNNLTKSLSEYGMVFYAGRSPLISSPAIRQIDRIQMYWEYFLCRLKGYNLYFFNSPGGVVDRSGKTKPFLFGLKLFITNCILLGLGVRRCWIGMSLEAEPLLKPLEGFYWLGPRDQNTADILKTVKSDYCELFCDLSLLADMPEVGSNGKSIVVSFRDPGADLRELLVEALRVSLKNILKNDGGLTKVSIFYQVDEDYAFCRMLESSLKEFNPIFHSDALCVERFSSFYRDAKYVISNRLHCLLLGAMNGCLPVALTRLSHFKIVSFYEINSLSFILLDYEAGFRVEDVAGIVENYDSYLRLVRKSLERSSIASSLVIRKMLS